MSGGPRRLAPWLALAGLALALRWIALRVAGGYELPWQREPEVMAVALVERGVLAFDFYGLTPLLPTAFLPPVYPLFIALPRWLAGPEYLPVLYATQALIGTLAVLAMVPVTRELTGSSRAGWLAGVMAAGYPPFVIAVAQINTVVFEVLGILGFAWALLRWARRPAWWPLAVAGLILGLLALTRGPALLIWPLVGLWLLVVYPSRALHRRLAWIAVFSACLILPMVPWMVRNQAVIGAPVMIATNGGVNFWIGHNPAADGEYRWPPETDRALAERAAALSEPERDELYYSLGLQFARANPGREVELGLAKLWYFVWFRPNLGSSYPGAGVLQNLASTALMAGYGIVLLLALPGIWLNRRTWRRDFVIHGLWFAYAASSVIYFAATRFRAPVEPFLIAWAALTLTRLAELIRLRRRDPAAEAIGPGDLKTPDFERAGS